MAALSSGASIAHAPNPPMNRTSTTTPKTMACLTPMSRPGGAHRYSRSLGVVRADCRNVGMRASSDEAPRGIGGASCPSLSRISSRGPNAEIFPALSTSILSTCAMSPVRWAIRMTVVPFARIRTTAWARRLLAVRIEVRIRLVQDEERRIAEDGTRETDALVLAAGDRDAAGADPRVVAAGQAEDHFMCAGELCGGDHLLVLGMAQARDVVAHRAREQLDVLRQIADMAPPVFVGPGSHVRVVQANMPRRGRQRADDEAHQGGLAGARWPDDAQRLAAVEAEARPLEHRLAHPGGT